MGFLAKVPWGKIGKGIGGLASGPLGPAIGIGASLLGGWLGKKAVGGRSEEEKTALAGAQGTAGTLGNMGRSLFSGGQDTLGRGVAQLGQAGNYWQTLLGGNRAAMAQATAGPRGAITDQYRGAERSLERSGVRGGIRDLAAAEMSRDRAGKIAGLTTGVQPAAAQGLADVGGRLGQLGLGSAGLGVGATGDSANIWSRLLGSGFENRKYARGEGEKAGSGIGSLIFDILSGLGGGGKKPLSSRTTTPLFGSLPSGTSRSLF